jgi:multicomponent Na+:H+ antiporter subunit D
LMRNRSGSDYLPTMGGLAKQYPWLAVLFIIAALSLAGLPPLSGFFGKWILLRQTFVMDYPWLAAAAIATSLFTLMSMLKIWSYGFWSTAHDEVAPAATRKEFEPIPDQKHGYPTAMLATGFLVTLALSMGLGAGAYFALTHKAAEMVVNPDRYIAAVLPNLPATTPTVAELQASAVERQVLP